jgi:hypothetical protein
MSESLHASENIVLSPRFYRFAASAFGGFVQGWPEPLTSEGQEVRLEEWSVLERAAKRPGRYPDVVVGLGAALEMRAGSAIRYESFMRDYYGLRPVRGHRPDPWQLINAERALVHAAAMREFGDLLETAILEGCGTLEDAEQVLRHAQGKASGSAMKLASKVA